MQSPFAHARVLHCTKQHRMGKELAVLDHQIDTRDIHVNNASGANVQMSHFAISHLSCGQADERPAGMNQRVGIFAEQTVIGWLARQRNGIGLGFGAVSPAVENDEDERFRASHKFGKERLRFSLS